MVFGIGDKLFGQKTSAKFLSQRMSEKDMTELKATVRQEFSEFKHSLSLIAGRVDHMQKTIDSICLAGLDVDPKVIDAVQNFDRELMEISLPQQMKKFVGDRKGIDYKLFMHLDKYFQ